ncbi:MAG TPA: TIGR02206 family membrane protein [Bacilli bacterium]
MGDLFRYDHNLLPFTFFSRTHNSALLTILVLIAVLYFSRHALQEKRAFDIVRFSLAGILIAFEIALYVWYFAFDEWSLDASLPFQLCSFTMILSIIMLLTKSYTLYEFTYFAGIGGAVQALVTPSAILSDFPHFTYYYFFIAHGGIVISCLLMTWANHYRPTFKSIWKTWLFLNIYMLFIVFVNKWTNGNYLFIVHKPELPSLLDYLGPWPWYIVSMELIGIVTFLLLYFPFAILDWRKKAGK